MHLSLNPQIGRIRQWPQHNNQLGRTPAKEEAPCSPRGARWRAAPLPLLSSTPASSPSPPSPGGSSPGTWLAGLSLRTEVVAPGARGAHQPGLPPRWSLRIDRALDCAAYLAGSSGSTASEGFAMSHCLVRRDASRQTTRGRGQVIDARREDADAGRGGSRCWLLSNENHIIKLRCRRCAAGL